jgi:hypothetical protein
MKLLHPEWPAPAGVHAFMTTRSGGVSRAPWDTFNLGDHVGDDPEDVAANRALLRERLPGEPGWLKQVHSARVVELASAPTPEADASWTRHPGRVCAVLTADCLPVLFCDRDATVVAAAHAGWRGLAGGVLEATVAAMGVPRDRIVAWMGAAIGPQAFEVGDDVRQVFVNQDRGAAAAFVPQSAPGKWLADIYALARLRLKAAGVDAVYGGGHCTFGDAERFFSYRRDGATGRMASLIWLG